MQLVGLPLLIFIIWFGFSERDFDKISAFDSHALIMVLVGCLAAILSSSSAVTAWRTFSCLRELIPNAGILAAQTDALEQERTELRDFWLRGDRAPGAQPQSKQRISCTPKAHRSGGKARARCLDRDSFYGAASCRAFQVATGCLQLELLSKLGPSFGMVGTITGMIQLFKSMGTDNLNIGAAMSLASSQRFTALHLVQGLRVQSGITFASDWTKNSARLRGVNRPPAS